MFCRWQCTGTVGIDVVGIFDEEHLLYRTKRNRGREIEKSPDKEVEMLRGLLGC